MIRRRIVLAYWVVAIGAFMPCAAHAYIDPATTTYIIQIMTALVVTLGISLSIFLYKFNMLSAKIKFGFYGVFYRLFHRGADHGTDKREERVSVDAQAEDAAQTARYAGADYYIPARRSRRRKRRSRGSADRRPPSVSPKKTKSRIHRKNKGISDGLRRRCLFRSR